MAVGADSTPKPANLHGITQRGEAQNFQHRARDNAECVQTTPYLSRVRSDFQYDAAITWCGIGEGGLSHGKYLQLKFSGLLQRDKVIPSSVT